MIQFWLAEEPLPCMPDIQLNTCESQVTAPLSYLSNLYHNSSEVHCQENSFLLVQKMRFLAQVETEHSSGQDNHLDKGPALRKSGSSKPSQRDGGNYYLSNEISYFCFPGPYPLCGPYNRHDVLLGPKSLLPQLYCLTWQSQCSLSVLAVSGTLGFLSLSLKLHPCCVLACPHLVDLYAGLTHMTGFFFFPFPRQLPRIVACLPLSFPFILFIF